MYSESAYILISLPPPKSVAHSQQFLWWDWACAREGGRRGNFVFFNKTLKLILIFLVSSVWHIKIFSIYVLFLVYACFIRIQEAGLQCPDVFLLRKHILLMRFIGNDQVPAQKLKEAILTNKQGELAYEQCVYVSSVSQISSSWKTTLELKDTLTVRDENSTSC